MVLDSEKIRSICSFSLIDAINISPIISPIINVIPNPALVVQWLSNKCLFSLALGKTLCFATTTLMDAATNFDARL